MFKMLLARAKEARAAELQGESRLEAGFTLIELMVVLLIIAILLAIAIPTFLGVTGSANDRAAQSNLTNGLTEAKALYQNAQTYTGINVVASAPEFKWVTGASPTGDCPVGTANCVSWTPVDVASAGDGAGVVLASLSKTGTCWYVMSLEATPGVVFIPADAKPPYQAISGTAAGAQENAAGAALPTAGTFYSQVAKGTTPTACNAINPLTFTAAWKWGANFPNAPQL
jgi:type IV pilus assembly protein PilA